MGHSGGGRKRFGHDDDEPAPGDEPIREDRDVVEPQTVFGTWTVLTNSGYVATQSGTGLFARQEASAGRILVRNHNSVANETEANWRLHPYWTAIAAALTIT